MNEHSHVAMRDLYDLVNIATRTGASRAAVGPVAMELLRGAFAPYTAPPPPGITETLMGLPIEADEEIPAFGWQLHDRNNRVIHAGCFTVHDHDCGEHG